MKTQQQTVQAYKFSTTAQATPPITIENPIEFLKEKIFSGHHAFGLDNIQRYGTYKLGGWAYDLRPYLKRILVKQYGSWSEYYAPNKTMLRSVIYGKIDRMTYLD